MTTEEQGLEVGLFTIVPYDGDEALMSEDVIGIVDDYVSMTLIDLHRPRWFAIDGKPLRLHPEANILRRTIAVPEAQYEKLGFEGNATDDIEVDIWRKAPTDDE